MSISKICETCFFFEYLDDPKARSFTQGHCKLLELIHNKRTVKCLSFESCIGRKDYHIDKLGSQLTEEEKEAFKKLYKRRLDLLEKLNGELDDPYCDPLDERKEIVIELKKLGTTAKKYIEHIKFKR